MRGCNMSFINAFFLSLLSLTVLNGCVTVPAFRVPQPWVRSLNAKQAVNITGTFKVEVSGSTLPLLGNEQLTADKIASILSNLLGRRGCSITNVAPEYLVRLVYKTERIDRLRFFSTHEQSSALAMVSGAGANSGLGINMARAVNGIAYSSAEFDAQSLEKGQSYAHVISIEIQNKSGLLLWKGESTWESADLDLINSIRPVMQSLLANLPFDQTIRPEISEVKADHIGNYYRLFCKNKWFTCPALPYRITFKNGITRSKEIAESDLTFIENPGAFKAYIDLIETAENALPDGDENDWKKPIDISLWTKVTLGGQYLLGPSKKPVNILVKLYGAENGYKIDECKAVTDEEYRTFNERFSKWKQALRDYYDVDVK